MNTKVKVISEEKDENPYSVGDYVMTEDGLIFIQSPSNVAPSPVSVVAVELQSGSRMSLPCIVSDPTAVTENEMRFIMGGNKCERIKNVEIKVTM